MTQTNPTQTDYEATENPYDNYDHLSAWRGWNEGYDAGYDDANRLAQSPPSAMVEALRALDRIVSETLVEKGGPHRAKWQGEWIGGPAADMVIALFRSVQKVARQALATLPNGGQPSRVNPERAIEIGRELDTEDGGYPQDSDQNAAEEEAKP